MILVCFSSLLKSQYNCNVFADENCKKACEISNRSAEYQGFLDSQKGFDEAIKLCPSFDYGYSEKSVPYLKRGDFITWKKLIDKAVELNPKRQLGYRGWCQYQFLRNYSAAIKDIEDLEKLVGKDNVGFSQNGNYQLQIVKALCYKGLGDKQKAIDIIEHQLSKKDNIVLLFDYYHLGVLYYELADYNKAKFCFEKQIANSDYYAEPYYYLSLIYTKNNNVKAKEMIDKALIYYNEAKYIKDAYTTVMDKVYKEEIQNQLNYLINLN
ncbi:hypothetical protein EIB75_05520 [Epilithonimonas vandammei]|uniref:Tetratricopeptide repeat protein n=1 Tax=Epilithonimonas vandammei TaxID=2487072 RepID=A0A3G8ZLF7_9FLAO|nr:hypothetical protein [Epilithonimonas vandammei]AZI54741.1 hypothetical protein EIB75_05520 [Epilithonimonas vandammei]